MDDATFQSLLQQLREGPDRIEARLAGVPAELWDAHWSEGENGWTRRQVLAHIAANDRRQLTRVRFGLGDAGARADFDAEADDPDGWNWAQVNARAGRSVAELLAEQRAIRGEFVRLLESLTVEQRSALLPFRGRLVPLTESVPVLLQHLEGHVAEIAP